jgi:hypothetical protein
MLKTISLACLLLVVPARMAPADTATQFGLSARGIGMANAVSAIASDCSAVYYNPAGLALTADDDITVGYVYRHLHVSVRDERGSGRGRAEGDTRSMLFGYRKNLSAILPEQWSRNMGVGIVAQLQDELKQAALVRTSFYQSVQFPVFGRVEDVLVAGAGLGLEVHPRMYAGIGMRVGVTLDVQDVTVSMNLLNGNYRYLNMDANIDTELRPIAGVICRPWDALSIGAVWRRGGPIARIDVKGMGIAEAGAVRLPITFLFTFRDLFSPDETALSVAYRLADRVLTAFEITHQRWSAYNLPYNERPPGEPFYDIVVPRLGMEYSPTGALAFQAGYYFQPSPVRSRQPLTGFLDADQHVLSVAMEYSHRTLKPILARPLQFGLFLQYHHVAERTLEIMNEPRSIRGSIVNVGVTVCIPF